GPKSDRVLIFSDTNGDGRSNQRQVFDEEGFLHAMGLYWRSDREVYVATRRDVYRLGDLDGDGRADERRRIAGLVTEGDYPHNGLSGLSFDDLGNLYVGMGENLGKPYRLVGSDGRYLDGGTEGGDVFRMRPDGSRLERWSTGYWNAFAHAFDAYGRLFVVDNDPDARPPCRLIQTQRGGDHGYRFWLGRGGLHAYTSWNGGLPGTLGMVAGTGEAPSGVTVYEHGEFPKEYLNTLIVTSWGDHRIERYTVTNQRNRVQVEAKREIIVQGKRRKQNSFRPVDVRVAPDGSLFISDWGDQSYPVHGKGRIWRLRTKKQARAVRPMAPWTPPADLTEWERRLSHADRRVRERAREWGAKTGHAMLLGGAMVRGNDLAAYQGLVLLARDGSLGVHDAESILKTRNENELLPASAVRLFAESGEPRRWYSQRNEKLAEWASDSLHSTSTRAEALLHIDRLAIDGENVVDPIGIAAAATDPNLASAALFCATRIVPAAQLVAELDSKDPKRRLYALLAIKRLSGTGKGFVPFGERRIVARREWIEKLLRDEDLGVRRAAMQWVGEENRQDLREALESAIDERATRELVDVYLSTLGLLDGSDPKGADRMRPNDRLLKVVRDKKRSPALRAWALRSVPPGFDNLVDAELVKFLEEEPLAIEAIRSLAGGSSKEGAKALREVALDAKRPVRVRREAIIALAPRVPAAELDTMEALLGDPKLEIRAEAARAIRGAEVPETLSRLAVARTPRAVPGPARGTPQWTQGLMNGGRPEEGELLFYHPRGPRCASCHTIQGRGGLAGPDLSLAGRLGREKLLHSILEPSRDIGPLFATHVFTTRKGVVTGVLRGPNDDDQLVVAQADGSLVKLDRGEILAQQVENQSLMPDGLEDLLTYQEMRDLLAYLSSLGSP
ncbi:MAG: PVC-type heme-binding CxxCH protein, partial [Planctomycetota bacterium]